jgi:chromate reductase, NAD(P)H dehydrogenase (quinone)
VSHRVSTTRVLAISGSLRRHSGNSTLVSAVAQLAPDGACVSIYPRLEEIPPFNPDRDGPDPPTAVLDLREQLQRCDALVISSPEYAHGVPGVLKNALDWIVGSGELMGKPVALLRTSSRGAFAHASLVETMTVMSAVVVIAASVVVPLDGRPLTPAAIVADSELSAIVRSALAALIHAVGTASHR